ncbi:MAG: 50S ribosomal protein L16 [Candidatus Jordarchaeum sp.]|uniref:50S ribosomal protein L16 n=1 Tax=Candidatus Jordarchaeum sp. TaxID=2823881 RepID=UPI00404AB82D
MSKRPAKCYTRIDRPPYTRREYVRGGPDPKIRIYDMGNREKKFDLRGELIIEERCQVSHKALEALRISINRNLTNKMGKDDFHFVIHVKPFHIIRENRMMAFAGADRLQDGMRRAFGKPVGRVARVRDGQIICSVWTNDSEKNRELLKKILNIGGMKLPRPAKVRLMADLNKD